MAYNTHVIKAVIKETTHITVFVKIASNWKNNKILKLYEQRQG